MATSTALVERDSAVRLALLAALAGEHLLLLGPPGTAKSEVARRLRGAFQDTSYFERLLTRFTVPEELFGPLSIKALEEDRYHRLTTGYLPSASIAFLDEVFKANSAILNALLTLLNEREFDNGTVRAKAPLVCVVAASNELPEGEELHALYDRFLLRCHVNPVSDEGFERLLGLQTDGAPPIEHALRLSAAELEAIRAETRAVRVPADMLEMLRALRQFLQQEDIYVSDRRWRKIVRLLQAAAFTDGRHDVSIWDGWLLRHCTWHSPEQEEMIAEWYARRVGAASAMDPERFAKLTRAWEAAYQQDAGSQSQARDKEGRLLYVGQDGSPTVATTERRQKRNTGSGPLYLAPPNHRQDRTNGGKGYSSQELYSEFFHGTWQRDQYIVDSNNWLYEDANLPPLMEPTRYSEEHVSGRVRQVRAIAADVDRHLQGIEERLDSIRTDLAAHLWISSGFAPIAQASLEENRKVAKALQADLRRLDERFSSLPRMIGS